MGAITTLSPTAITVEAGALAATTIRVRNTGSIVDRFDIDVVGVTGWVRVDPPSLSLFPGAEGMATVTFGPPRASMPRAGTIPFGIRVRPAADPKGSAVEEGKVTVVPFTAAAADIVPQTSRGTRGAHHQVIVDNRGNAPVEVVVSAIDPDRLLQFTVEPPRAVVGPDDRVGFRVGVRVDDPFPFGPNRPRPFQVNVEPGRQGPIQLRATLSQRALLPAWLPRVGGLALAAVALGAVAVVAGVGPFAPEPGPSPSTQAQVSLPPSEPPSAPASEEVPSASDGSGESVPPSQGTGESPTREPLTPGDFTLAVTGDEVQLGNGLALRCATNDQACRDTAKETIRTILTELQNPYSGAGIPSTRILGVANTLPVVMSAGRDFPWRQLGAGEAGATERAVVDLGPLLASPASLVYAVVDTGGGQETRRFVVDPAFAKQLFDLLYQLPPEMGEVSPATPPPDMAIGDQIFVEAIDWNVLWVLATPAP
jgi:hypothetical protein